MEVHTGTGRFGLVAIAAGMVIGAALMVLAEMDHFAFDGSVVERAGFVARQWDWRWNSWLAGALAGGFAGAFSWRLWQPRIRLARGTKVVIAINWTAWAAFLAFTPQVDAARLDEIARQRPSGVSFVQDVPTILAARYFGGFRPLSLPEISLTLMAGPAVFIAEQYVVPFRYAGSPPTRRESWVIAVMAFVVSTAFWATISEAIVSLWRRKGRTVAA